MSFLSGLDVTVYFSFFGWKNGAARGITAHIEAITQEGIFHRFTVDFKKEASV